MIRFRCKCGKVLQTKSDHAGRPIKCPSCGLALRVPDGNQPRAGNRKKQRKSKAAAEAGSSSRQQSQRRRKAESPAPDDRATRRRRKSATPQPEAIEDFEEVDDFVDDSDFAPEDDFGADDDWGADDYGDYEDYAAPSMPSARKKKKKTGRGGGDSKKKAAAADDSEGLSPKVMYALFGVAGLVALGILGGVGALLMSASRESAASNEVPTEFKEFVHDEGRLTAEYPTGKGWFIETGGGTGGLPPWLTIEHEYQGVHIRIAGSNSGTAVGDIANAGGAGFIEQDLPDELEPIAAVHDFLKIKMEANYGKYEETAPVPIETGCGEGRMSSFVGTDVLSSDQGLRGSVMCHQFVFNVICKCPEKRMEDYRPIFERVISSVGK